MEYSIERVTQDNYPLFDDMVFWRINNRERTENERNETRDFSEVAATLANENLYVYAVQTESKFAGWISIAYIPKVGRTNGKGHLFIDELWVAPGYRRNGMAQALMKRADELSRELNTLGLRLYVSMDNAEAIPLYEKCGYQRLSEAYFMQKEWAG